MKFGKKSKKIGEELLANGVGWIAGLLSVDLLSHFFAIRSWKNAWGLFSRKTMISADTFNILEWVITAVFGFIVLVGVNKFLIKRFFNKKEIREELSKEIETQQEEQTET